MPSTLRRYHRLVYRALLLIFCAQSLLAVGAQGNRIIQDKPLSIRIQNSSLSDALKKVSKLSGIAIFFHSDELASFSNVSIDVKSKPLSYILHELLDARGFFFVQADESIISVRKNTSKTSSPSFIDSTITISGRITNEKGEGIAGATILIKGTKVGITAGPDGSFSLSHASPHAILVVSNIAYLSREISLNGNNTIGNIQLEEYIGKLDETIVIAYGTTSQRLSTGNVSTIKAVDIEKQPVSNPLLTLQGRVPGLFITQATGYAGSGVTVRIQGQNSITQGNDPLYVIDGVPFISQLLPSVNSIMGTSGNSPSQYNNRSLSGNPLNFINPNDIESIDVLKDADATAIYGSRAANGAILITTKKGKAGKFDVDVNIQTGWGQASRKLKLLNTQQYLEMRNEAFQTDGISPDPVYDYDVLNKYGWSPMNNTDWQKKLIGGTARYTNVQSSVSGGSDNVQFVMGGAYKKEGTVIPGDFSDQKGSLHSNINATSVNKKFNASLSTNYMIDYNQLPNQDLTQVAITMPPHAPSLRNADGSLNWAPDDIGNTTWGVKGNPLATLYNKYKSTTTNLVGNVMFSYQIIQGLELRSSFGYNQLRSNGTQINPLIGYAPELRATRPRISLFEDNSSTSWIVEPQVKYKKSFGNLAIDALVGGTIQKNNNKNVTQIGRDFASDNVMEDIGAATTLSISSFIKSVYNYNALFGRLNFNWRDKYILNLTGRRDGSSRFGLENLFHNFGSIGGAWLFSSEEFFKQNAHIISFGKLRASYGSTGSDQIGEYRFLNLYSPLLGTIAYQNVASNLPSTLPNSFLQWEETKKIQVGLDLGFWKDRILVSSSYFRNRSSNQLLEYVLPITTGFPSITSNFPATVQNSGWELSLSYSNAGNKLFKWSSGINITLPQNRLVNFPNLSQTPYANVLDIGQSLTIKRIYQFAGVNPTTGIYQFKDAKGVITSDPVDPADKIVRVNTDPVFYGGFQNSFTYKGVSLDFLFQFVKQKGQNYKFGKYPGLFDGVIGNQPITVLDRWKKQGDVTDIQRYNADFSLLGNVDLANFSNAAFGNASYVRLKNLSLSWQIPSLWRSKVLVKDLRLYLQGQNLLTFTNYEGLDPENKSSSTLPPLKMLTIGIKSTL